MINVAVLGYGVVGSGVVEVINKNANSIARRAGDEIVVKKILDLRDFPDSPFKGLLTKNSDEVFEDDSINVVVEVIGGAGVAYEFTKRALSLGKHVVTSNKELVATHGPELLKMAKDNNVHYLFEASVGGGIPIIRPMHNCLAANEISGITGILNGTTNYILTQMRKTGKDFGTALKEAQQKGYAEANPTADVEGQDACRKIAILSSIAYNEYVDYRKIPTEGISKLTVSDMHYADSMGCVIKLVGFSKREGEKIYARVSPMLISKESPLANVDDVFNAIVVKGDAIGDAMFYGRGAGKLPTASAVVADIVDVVRNTGNAGKNVWNIRSEENMVDPESMDAKFYVRILVDDEKKSKKHIEKVFKKIQWVASEDEKELVFVTEDGKESDLLNKINGLIDDESIKDVSNCIRVLY